MAGFLIPPWYQAAAPDLNDLLVATVIWGFTLGSGVFSAFKAFQQSKTSWERTHRIRPYVAMIWAEWIAAMTMGVVTWLFLRGIIEPSFHIFFAFVCLWTVKVQVLMQIIINRISLLMVNKSRAAQLKWTVAGILGLINISVFCIWIPAALQISPTFIHINHIWDRIEKVIFLIIDAGLNFYFMYVVRTKLIANGLSKYMPLFRFNSLIVGLSIALDITIIGVMSMQNPFIYVQVHPLVYLLKLHIEMNMADLIVKVVRETSHNQGSSGGDTELRMNNRSTLEEGTIKSPATARAITVTTYIETSRNPTELPYDRISFEGKDLRSESSSTSQLTK